MGLRSGLPHLGPPRRRVADLAAPIQLASAAQQSKIKSAHQPPRSYRGQPVEAPHLAAREAPGTLPTRGTSLRGAADHSRWTAWGARSPMPAKTRPTTPRPMDSQVSAIVPVITVADASTMAIWKAADEIS